MSASRLRLWRPVAAAAALFLASAHAGHADDFYKGKTITIVVGYGPGGGYELYARLLSEYMGRHIPGHPSIVVENMPGAGSIAAANYVYAIAPKDGTVIAAVDQTAPMHQLLGGSGAHFDSAKLQWLGSLAHSNSVAFSWDASGVRTLADARARSLGMGATAVSADTYIYPTIINALLGTRFKIILGYPDGPSIDLAIQRGEVGGNGAASWISVLTNHRSWVEQKKIDILLQTGLEKERDLPQTPLLGDLVQSRQGRELSDLISVSTAIGDAYWVAPGVPADRVAILREAFDKTARDPDLLAQTRKLGAEIRAQSGSEVGAQVSRIAKTSPAVLKGAARMLAAHG